MKIIKLLDYKIEYKEHKAEKVKGTILYVNGFAADINIFDPVWQKYNDYNFYTIAYPGYDNSEFKNSKDINIYFFKDLILEFIKLKKLKNIILVGMSLGGAIASLVYASNPDLFTKVMLISPVNLTTHENIQKLKKLFFPISINEWVTYAKKTYYKVERKLNDRVFMANKQKWINRINSKDEWSLGQRNLAKGVYELEILKDVEKAMSKLPKVTYLVNGKKDNIVNQNKIYDYFKTNFPSIIQITFSESDHGVFVWEYEKFLEMFTKFLESENQ